MAYTTASLSWHDLIKSGGGFDQIHFYNDLLQITGLTPAAFFTQQYTITEKLISNQH